jgi:hypothetical protein
MEVARALRSPAALALKLGDGGQDGVAHTQGLAGTFLTQAAQAVHSGALQCDLHPGQLAGLGHGGVNSCDGCGWRCERACETGLWVNAADGFFTVTVSETSDA